MNRYFIAFGGNLGDVELSFKKAALFMEQSLGKITLKSKLYTSKALKLEDTNEDTSDYLNSVICLESSASEKTVLAELNSIEKKLGRKKSKKWASRVIDLDIIANEQKLFEDSDLTIPHKEMHKRTFVLLPLQEIAPAWIHPKLKKTVSELINDLEVRTPCEILKSFPDYES